MLTSILLFPLAGVLVNLLFGWRRGEKFAGWVATGAMGLAFLAAAWGFFALLGLPPGQRALRSFLFEWIPVGGLQVKASFLLDPLSSVMALVVTGVGFLIHLYSVGYMHGDRGAVRYFIYLNLFSFSMLTLVLGDNFLVLFVGWEAVGLCSYLLIGFWHERDSAAEAGKKAFVVNRVGDFCFLIALFLVFSHFGSLDFGVVLPQAAATLGAGSAAATLICLLLFGGATGKSAQIPLYVWLPDAMEGPTPVSALIHAATMVTAGVYMVARMSALFALSPLAMGVVATIGALTLLLAGSIAVAQNDIKRVLAYSTVSQLGYMFLAAGVGAYTAAIFHLVTHAFFKALLFLGSGSVIHALHGEQDIRRMGGLRAGLPVTSWTFTVGGLAIAGIFPFAGFFSKDAILFAAMTSPHGGLLFWLAGAAGAFMTAFYMFRLIFKTFHGKCSLPIEQQARLHESPRVMLLPLQALAALSIAGGWMGLPLIRGADFFGDFLGPVFGKGAGAHHEVVLEVAMMAVSLAVALLGIFMAYNFYIRGQGAGAAYGRRWPRLYRLLLNKYYVDELYDGLFVQPIKRASIWTWRAFEDGLVDAAVNGAGAAVEAAGGAVRRLQTGYVKSYAVAMLAGAFAILVYLSVRGG
ncbi:MAG: NADH-quinone oxidoreductase subunit L [Candidatus Tectomicrobia bacterium]|nr:NADH-quinone oxidoreductase subunit L [Candidatus Tectomicrobia bacterium]